MTRITTAPLPDDAFLRRYFDAPGTYTDCFMVTVPRTITLPQFVEAFYTAPLFRCERVILKLAAKRPSTDRDAADIANGMTERFAAWNVEARNATQLLMCDMAAKTRSWFMTRDEERGTRLYFGSAVTANPQTGDLGFLFNLLLPFHKLYSRALLTGAIRQLNRDPAQAAAR